MPIEADRAAGSARAVVFLLVIAACNEPRERRPEHVDSPGPPAPIPAPAQAAKASPPATETPAHPVEKYEPGTDRQVALAGVAPMRFVRLAAARFPMGSSEDERTRFVKLLPDALDRSEFDDETLHTATISSFELATTEVTGAQWRVLMGAFPAACDECSDARPVQGVSWNRAIELSNALTEYENQRRALDQQRTPCYTKADDEWRWDRTCTGYRLPTEAEWEYAARAGTRTAYSFGNDPRKMCLHGNASDQSHKREKPTWIEPNFDCDDGNAFVAEVASYKPNKWKLHDMHGNLHEWVWDAYGPYPAAANVVERDYAGPPTDERGDRVIRGGSFIQLPWNARAAARSHAEPTDAGPVLGLRVARGALARD